MGVAFAPLPVLILWYSSTFQYATEARPYAALCFWFCLLLVLWDLALSTNRRKFILAGVALSSLGLLLSHVFGTLTLFGFFVAEIGRFRARRKPDFPLGAALFLPAGLIPFYWPFFESYRTITDYPVAFQATPATVVSFYWHTFRAVFWLLCLAGFSAALTARWRFKWQRPALRNPEWMLLYALALVPVLLDIIMMLDHAPFWGRYCITSACALYFLCAVFLAAPFRNNLPAVYTALSAAFALVLVQNALVPIYEKSVQPSPANVAFLQNVKPGLPLVAASGLTFVEMGQYEAPQLTSRLFYLEDHRAAVEFAHATMFEDLPQMQQAFKLPGTVESYTHFVRDHRAFLVFGSTHYPEDWLLRKLAADGASITFLGTYSTPYKDKALFAVHIIPSPAAK